MQYDRDKNTITTTRLTLRPFILSDAEEVSRLCNNYNLYKGTLNLPYPYPIDSAIGWINTHQEAFENEASYTFAITDQSSGILYGAIGISHNKADRNGEVGYWIGEDFWGNGYASEALKALIDFVFQYKNYHRVFGRFLEFNPASGQVMHKVGMNYEGTQIDHVLKDGEFKTIVLYGIINPSL